MSTIRNHAVVLKNKIVVIFDIMTDAQAFSIGQRHVFSVHIIEELIHLWLEKIADVLAPDVGRLIKKKRRTCSDVKH